MLSFFRNALQGLVRGFKKGCHKRFYTGDFGLYSWVPRSGDFIPYFCPGVQELHWLSHSHWVDISAIPGVGWGGVGLFELPPSCTADEKPDTNTDICQCPCHCLSACVRRVWFLARSQRFLHFGPWVYWLYRNKQGVLPKDYAAGDAMLTAFSRPSEENLQTSSPVTGLPSIAVCLQPFVV